MSSSDALVKAKKAIQSQWKGRMTVIEYVKQKDPVTKQTDFVEQTVLEDKPCRVSFKTIATTQNSNGVAEQLQGVKLFCSPDLTIKPGSKIIVTQNGVTTEYQSSGVPAVHTNHQEIMLTLFKRWA